MNARPRDDSRIHWLLIRPRGRSPEPTARCGSEPVSLFYDQDLRRAEAEVAESARLALASELNALKAFELHAVDYLLKPYSKKRFARAVERLQPRTASWCPGATAPPSSTATPSARSTGRATVTTSC